MESEQYKSYRTEPTIHKIEVRAFDEPCTYLYVSCKICKYQEKCAKVKHKSEICVVAGKLNKIIGPISYCRVSSFLTDEFYVKRNHTKTLKETAKFFRMKYIVENENVRS